MLYRFKIMKILFLHFLLSSNEVVLVFYLNKNQKVFSFLKVPDFAGCGRRWNNWRASQEKKKMGVQSLPGTYQDAT